MKRIKVNADIYVGNDKLATVKDIDNSIPFVTPEMFGAKADGITDDATAIQNAIDYCRDNGNVLKFTSGKTYLIKKRIVLYSNITIEAYGATIKKGDVFDNMFVTDKYENKPTVTNNSKNITIMGGTFDAGNTSNLNFMTSMVFIFYGVDNLTLKDINCKSETSNYFFLLADTNNTYINNIRFNVYKDCIHLSGLNYKTVIENIYDDYSGDDCVAVTTDDGADYYGFVSGNVEDLTIRNIYTNNSTRSVLLGNTAHVIKNVNVDNIHQYGSGASFAMGSGSTCFDDNIIFENIYLSNLFGGNIRVAGYHMINVNIDNCEAQVSLGSENATSQKIEGGIKISNCNMVNFASDQTYTIDNVVLENIHGRLDFITGDNIVVKNHVPKENSENYAILFKNIKNITFENCKYEMAASYTSNNAIIAFPSGGSADTITFKNCSITGVSENNQLVKTRSVVNKLVFDNCNISKFDGLLYYLENPSVQTILKVFLLNSEIGTKRLLSLDKDNVSSEVYITNSNISTTMSPFYMATTQTISVYGNGWSGRQNNNPAGTGTLKSYMNDFPVDVTKLTLVEGGKCYNNNESVSGGKGFCVCNGTTWYNLNTQQSYS